MRKFGLVGKKLNHSFSKLYFEKKFKAENIFDAEYSLYEIDYPEDIKTLLLKDRNIVGLNVTNPFKKAVIPFLDELSEAAADIGAVNTIAIKNDSKSRHLIGYNTDYVGFYETIKDKILKKALVLGTGGSAAAISYALKLKNCEVIFVSRECTRGFSYNSLDKSIIESVDIIVNCTPLGIFPDNHTYPPIPYKYINDKHFLYDLVYNPEETFFLHNGVKRGAKVKNGLEMLYIQAEESWKIWQNSSSQI